MRGSARLVIASVLIGASLSFALDLVAIGDIVKDPAKFDNTVVTVTGKVDRFQQKTSKAGNFYYNMKVLGKVEDQVISVYGRGQLERALENGKTIEVTGRFSKEKKVGNITFKNEIDVTKDPEDKKTKSFGIKVIE